MAGKQLGPVTLRLMALLLHHSQSTPSACVQGDVLLRRHNGNGVGSALASGSISLGKDRSSDGKLDAGINGCLFWITEITASQEL